jgi:hypothetical protein
VELIEMINTLNVQEIEQKCAETAERNPGTFDGGAMWIQFKASQNDSRRPKITSDTLLLPEFGTVYDHLSSLVTAQATHSIISEHPSPIIIEVREGDAGTLLVGKES